MIQEQGSFAAGGKVIKNPGTFNPKQPTPEGQTLHGDHAYVFYQVPVNPRKLSLVFLQRKSSIECRGLTKVILVFQIGDYE
jgi:hypothetical protein